MSEYDIQTFGVRIVDPQPNVFSVQESDSMTKNFTILIRPKLVGERQIQVFYLPSDKDEVSSHGSLVVRFIGSK